ncbi:MAG: NADAR family protein, partial [Actinobacteria bacterium]|nr:NADAR family protein [Actinomycetota bacterium]
MDADAPREEFELLLQAEVQGTLPPFLFFWRHVPEGHDPGPWVLSQWWPAGFEIGGVAYANSEAYMMAEKARLFGDEDVRARILKSNHPADAKKLGRLVRGF